MSDTSYVNDAVMPCKDIIFNIIFGQFCDFLEALILKRNLVRYKSVNYLALDSICVLYMAVLNCQIGITSTQIKHRMTRPSIFL